MATLPLFISGLVLIVFNAQTLKTLALPLTFLLALAPPPLEIVYAMGETLAVYTSNVVYAILKALGLQVTLTTQSGLPVLMLEKSSALPQTLVMDTAFVGVYPLIIFTVFWVFVAFTVRGAAWKRAATFLAWFPSILVFNTVRVTIMTLVAYHFGIGTASEGLYTIGGWLLTLTGSFLFLFFASRKILKIHIFSSEPKLTSCPSCDTSREKKRNFCLNCGKLLKNVNIKISKRDVLKIASITAIVSLSTLLAVPAFALKDDKIQVINYLPREGKVDNPVLPEIPSYALSFGYPDKELETIVYPNASLTYVYTPEDVMKPTIYGAIEFANPKDVPELRGEILDSRDAQVLQDPPITGKLVTLHRRDSDITLVGLYWYERAVFDSEATIVRRYVRASVFAFSNGTTDYGSVGENLIPVAQAIAGYWEPARVWSDISSLFPEYLYALSIIVVGFMAVVLAFYGLSSEKEKRLNLKAFNKLALDDEKNVLQAVHQAEKTGKDGGNAIAASFQNLAGRPIDQNRLSDALRHAEEMGLIRSRIENENGEPVLAWRTQIAFPSSK
jgi:exosortase/archaeosortase family protein